MSEEAAYHAACLAYCRRVCGRTMTDDASPYQGDFDIEALVAEAQLPRNPTLNEQRAAWAGFRRLFSERWLDHERERA